MTHFFYVTLLFEAFYSRNIWKECIAEFQLRWHHVTSVWKDKYDYRVIFRDSLKAPLQGSDTFEMHFLAKPFRTDSFAVHKLFREEYLYKEHIYLIKFISLHIQFCKFRLQKFTRSMISISLINSADNTNWPVIIWINLVL